VRCPPHHLALADAPAAPSHAATRATQRTSRARCSAFEPAGLREFVRNLRYEPVAPVGNGGRLGEVATQEPWDGRDAAVEMDDEFSLDDIMGDGEGSAGDAGAAAAGAAPPAAGADAAGAATSEL
jgi:hypothetical protein